ncbi:hypothetical protein O4H26_05510 [Aequorivita viscosa]|nr:hypothetical protein [Aequorivita viscosa]
MKFVCYCTILLLLFSETNMAQQPITFQHFGVGEGLSSADVTTIFQDSRGYMWIGTGNGLNRGNGKQFTVYTVSSDSSKTSLPNAKIRSIFEDRHRSI